MINGQGEFVLGNTFSDVRNLYFTPLFVVSTKDNERQGLFDARSKRWILDTLNFHIFLEMVMVSKYNSMENYNIHAEKQYFIVFKNLQTRKFGLLDIEGKPVLAAEYDTLAIVSGKKSLFWYRQGEVCRILDLKNKQMKRSDYTFLKPHIRPTWDGGISHYFMAKKGNKLGVIQADSEQVVVPFQYDYGAIKDNRDVILVKNQEASFIYYGAFPKANRRFINQYYTDLVSKRQLTFGFNSIENPEKIFFTDREGKVLMPPQYRQVSKKDDYAAYVIVEDDDKRQKIVFLDKARVVDFPFDYTIEMAQSKSKVILVSRTDTSIHYPYRDFASKKFGVVSTEGKLLTPCENFAVAIGDAEKGVYFVKKALSTPKMDAESDDYYPFCNDTFNIEDNHWLMFDAEGKQLDATPFRMPIDFKNGVGVGIKGDKYGIFKSDGTTLLPPQYPMIWRDDSTGLYVIFKNIGLLPSIVLMDNTGKNRIETGRYDGISPFFGKYALVSSSGKIGLVDTLGKEIIAPQDLRTSGAAFADSLYLMRLTFKKAGDLYWKEKSLGLPFRFFDDNFRASKDVHPDSLDITPSLRNAVWNLLLEKHLSRLLHYVGDLTFNRTPLKVNPEDKEKYGYRSDCHRLRMTTRRLAASESFTSFLIDVEREKKNYYNFYRRNDRWEEVKAGDFWKTDADSRNQYYNVLVKKIKQLKDADIDCSNLTDLVDRTQSQFLMTENGVNVSLDVGMGYGYSFNTVWITFSWEEIKPFLKMSFPNR